MQTAPPPEIIDIIAPVAPPPAPPAYGWWAFALCLLLLLMGIAYYMHKRRHRVREKALAQLHHTRKALQQQQITPRAAAFAVGQALQGAPSLRDESAKIHALLDRARYAPQEPAHDTALQLLSLAQSVLQVKS